MKYKILNTGWSDFLMPKLVMLPAVIVVVIFIYGFIGWTGWVSLTKSTILPKYSIVGFQQYFKLFENARWWVASGNLLIYGSLFILFAMIIGLFLAIILDQKIKMEGFFRTAILYPIALSYIVTGVVWKWILSPNLGIEKFVQNLGYHGFTFDWIVTSDMAIYTIAISAVWQASGFVMVLFLAGLRSIDSSLIEAAAIDGASKVRTYVSIVIPNLRPIFFSVIIILAHLSIKSFDLVVAQTRGGPGFSTDLPAIFMYQFSFNRSKMAMGASSAIIMLGMILIVIIPYIYMEFRSQKNAN